MPDIFVATENQIPTPADSLREPTSHGEHAGLHPLNDNNYSSRRMQLFSAFSKNPRGIHFKNQEREEKILLFIRKAIITNFKWLFISAIFLLLPPLIFIFVNFGNQIITFPLIYVIYFLLFYYLIILAYMYVNFITWYFNIAFVTNIRIIDIDFSGLIYKNIAATKLSLVQDVSFNQIGVVRTFFNYGDVFVQTAGTYENFEFEAAPQPENAVHIIEDLIGRRGHGNI